MTTLRPVRPQGTQTHTPRAPEHTTAARPSSLPPEQRDELARGAADHASRAAGAFVENASAPAASATLSTVAAGLKAAGNVAADATRSSTTDVHGSLSGNALLVGTPSNLSSPTVADSSGVTPSLSGHGFSVSTNRAHDDVSDAASFDLSRASISVDVSRTRTGTSNGAGVYVDMSCVDVSASTTTTSTDGTIRKLGGDVGFTKSSVWVGMSRSVLAPGGKTVKLGVIGSLSADRAVADLGAYAGDDARLKGTRQIQLTRSVSGGLAGSGGVALAVGIGGRLSVDKGKDVTFTTHLAQDQAKAVLTEGAGALSFLRNKARALGAAHEPVVVPDLSDPSTMKVGDQLTIKTSGSVTGGVALGLGNVTAGVQATMTGEFELSAAKLDDNIVELAISPRTLRGVQVFADTGYLLDVGHTQAHGEGFRQVFTFDLSKPDALAAYQRALKGELPNGLSSKELPKEEKDLAALVRDEKLPAGVARNVLERADVNARTTGGGLNWGLVQSAGGIAGLSYLRSTVEGSTVTTTGNASLVTENRGVERRREVLLSGTEIDGVSGSVRTLTVYDAQGRGTRAFDSLELTARFSDDRVLGLELNDEVLDRINDAFGTTLEHFERAGHKQSRDVTLTRALTAADLEKLAGISAIDAREAAGLADVKDKSVQALVTSLKASKDAEARAGLVKDFVAKEGLKGFGVVHRLLGGALDVKTDSNAYTKPVEAAAVLALKYESTISSTDDANTITVRFKDVLPVLKDVEEAQLDLQDDRLLKSDEKKDIGAKLEKTETQLELMLSFDGLTPVERKKIHDEISGGWWTTSTESVVLEKLNAAGIG